jgi:hypothetical protein
VITQSVTTPATPKNTTSSGTALAPTPARTVIATVTRMLLNVPNGMHPLLLGGDCALWILLSETTRKASPEIQGERIKVAAQPE